MGRAVDTREEILVAMKACSKCPEKHAGAEAALSRKLSCTEVKRFWIKVRKEHKEEFGHLAEIAVDDVGDRFCSRCNRKLILRIADESFECLRPGDSSFESARTGRLRMEDD